jgi:GTPase Era involved in 16S rRNA processing
MDLPESQENLALLREALNTSYLEIIPLSAEKLDNIEVLIATLRQKVEESKR